MRADGTVHLLANEPVSSTNLTVARVDAASGTVTSQALGFLTRGPYFYAVLGVGEQGQLAVLSSNGLHTLELREWLAP